MIWSDELAAAIDAATTRVPPRDLARAAEALSARYRGPDARPVTDARRIADVRALAEVRPLADMRPQTDARPLTDAERAAYLAVRAPATYAAVSAVLRELRARCPDLTVRSLLDLGAGPGVGIWAVLAQFEQVTQVTAIERDRGFASLGRTILDASGLAAHRRVEWQHLDLASLRPVVQPTVSSAARSSNPIEADSARATTPARHDIVLLSYALGELTADVRARVLNAAWQSTTGALVIVEPGTPRHFAVVLDARAQLLRLGGAIAAPCPHANDCPLAAIGDWCHVAARLPRTTQHRRLKAGSLAYEDEKFSYLVITRASCQPAASRVVRHPQFGKGHVGLTRCTPTGLVTEVIGRAARDTWRLARKAKWGDAWPPISADDDEMAADDAEV